MCKRKLVLFIAFFCLPCLSFSCSTSGLSLSANQSLHFGLLAHHSSLSGSIVVSTGNGTLANTTNLKVVSEQGRSDHRGKYTLVTDPVQANTTFDISLGSSSVKLGPGVSISDMSLRKSSGESITTCTTNTEGKCVFYLAGKLSLNPTEFSSANYNTTLNEPASILVTCPA